jgi:hypothetical protein
MIERVIAEGRASRSDAEKLVDDTNRQREQYVRRQWNRNWLAPENYHLCVNTGRLGTEGAAILVVEAARQLLVPRRSPE